MKINCLPEIKSVVIICFTLLTSSNGITQNLEKCSYRSSTFQIPLQRTLNVSGINNDLYFQLTTIEAPNNFDNSGELSRIKNTLPSKIYSSTVERSANIAEKPIVLTNFEGNQFHGHVPNDNHLAVSNGNKIISVTNSIIYFYENDSQIHEPVSLDTFGASIVHPHGKYDPRVIYDPVKDRFILVFLNGFTDQTSFIYVAFSKSNDPLGDWNIYTLPGNPNSDSSWTDFPMISLSSDELFLTVNLLKNMGPGDTWKTTFKQTIIWQINLNDGYNGNQLTSRLWDSIHFNGKNLRNICPVSAAIGNPATNMYLLSNMNFSVQTDTFFLLEITGKLDNAATQLKMKYLKSDKPYGVAPSADMPFNRLLETNDARILDAFIVNNTIHFVGNTIDFNNNKATLYHGRVKNTNLNPTITLKTLNHPYLEFGYPNIEYTGNGTTDEAIILVNHSCDTVNPGVSAFFYKDNEWSDNTIVKKGETTVTVQTGKTQRWGDYTGLQRKYNENGTVWGSGYYGKFISPTQRYNSTWICQLKSPSYTFIRQESLLKNTIRSYPNPSDDIIKIEFFNDKLQEYSFTLFNSEGKLIKLLRKDFVKPGKQQITLFIKDLPKGSYFVAISNSSGLLEKHIIVKN